MVVAFGTGEGALILSIDNFEECSAWALERETHFGRFGQLELVF